jgi:hypothetical protein
MQPDSISDAFVAAWRSAGITGLRLHGGVARTVKWRSEDGLRGQTKMKA